MVLQERINLLVQLGTYLRSDDDFLAAIFHRVAFNNAWLTKTNSLRAAKLLGGALDATHLLQAAEQFQLPKTIAPKKIGVVLSGNLPLQGVWDIMTIFLSGHASLIKCAESDKYTIPHLVKMLQKWNPACIPYFQVMDRFLKDFDAIIATKANEKSTYFEAYFGKYPNLIRSNKNSIAVLTGTETATQLLALGDDVFAFFGLSPNSVSKLYLPKDYHLDHLLGVFHEEYKEIVLNNKYKNNFDYNYSLFLLNNVSFKVNGCVILVEHSDIPSRIGCLHYEYYEGEEQLHQLLEQKQEQIQFIVSEKPLLYKNTLNMGRCHLPLWATTSQEELIQFLKSL